METKNETQRTTVDAMKVDFFNMKYNQEVFVT